jgi:outer membrane receptor protein involved in Fe transport
MHSRQSSGFRLSVLALAIAGIGASDPQRVLAAEEVEEVIVSGSRLASSSGFTTPTPVTTLGEDEIERLNITNIGAGISQLPAFRPSNNPTTNGWGSFNVGAQIVNLRGLGVNRNLVLVDNRRFAPVTREGTVDLNLIPSGLVQRTDVVTGGASAAYGSDAIAGAVNVILNKTLTGLKGQVDYGQSQEGDGENYHLSLAGGADFLDGRGHVVIGGEYDNQKGIGDCYTRDWCEGGSVITNSGVGALAGAPAFVRTPTGGGFFANPGGVVAILNNNTAATLPIRNLFGTGGVSFNSSGDPIPYNLGKPASGNNAANGDVFPSMTTAQLLVPVERHTVFSHADFDINDSLRGFLEGSFGRVSGDVLQSRYFGAPIAVYNDNPFVPAQIRALLPPVSATPSGTRPSASAFNLAVLGQRQGNSASEVQTYRVTFGLDGQINDSWSWDAYYQYADTERDQSVRNNMVTGSSRVINRPGSGGVSNPDSNAYWAWANDPVYDPADAATPAAQRRIVCRATLSPDAALRTAASGCAPFNPFGEGRASQAALDYVYRTLEENIQIDQHVAAANLQGTVAELWAGDLAMATGIEFRRDSTALVHDKLSTSFAYFQNFGADYNAEQDVSEAYIEAELPLLKDMPLAKGLNLNAAARRTSYDISGFGGFNQSASSNKIYATSWKLGLLWDPLDWLRFRVTRSRDIRAPNFNDLFQASASSFTAVTNRFVAGNPAQFPAGLAGGNPVLDAERSITSTVGLILQPNEGWLSGVRFSADYYDINVDGYIGTPGGAQNIVDRCFAFSEQLTCDLIVFGPNNSLAEIRNVNVNLQWLRTRGIDMELSYSFDLGSLIPSVPGEISTRFLATRVMENATNLFGVITDRAGETGGAGMPEWLSTVMLTYSNENFSTTLSGRYIDSGKFNALWIGPDDAGYAVTKPLTINDNSVDSAFYLNLSASYNLSAFGEGEMQVFGTVANLLGEEPPSAPSTTYPTNPVYFDQIGRTFRVGMRFSF